jgi:hypothetical protein
MLKPKSSQLSFYGDHIYDRIIPEDHFLKQLEKAIDFSFVNDLCRDAYNPDVGRPAYEPQMMFRMLFLQFLYDISDRRAEEEINFNLVLKWTAHMSRRRWILSKCIPSLSIHRIKMLAMDTRRKTSPSSVIRLILA